MSKTHGEPSETPHNTDNSKDRDLISKQTPTTVSIGDVSETSESLDTQNNTSLTHHSHNNNTSSKTPSKRHTPLSDNLFQVLLYRFKHNYTYTQIAEIYGVTKQAVQFQINNFIKNLADTPEKDLFDSIEPQVYRTVKLKYLQHLLDPETIKKSSSYHSAYTIDKMNTVQRLGEGKATEIIDIEGNSQEIAALQKALDEFERREAETIDVTPEQDEPSEDTE